MQFENHNRWRRDCCSNDTYRKRRLYLFIRMFSIVINNFIVTEGKEM